MSSQPIKLFPLYPTRSWFEYAPYHKLLIGGFLHYWEEFGCSSDRKELILHIDRTLEHHQRESRRLGCCTCAHMNSHGSNASLAWTEGQDWVYHKDTMDDWDPFICDKCLRKERTFARLGSHSYYFAYMPIPFV